MVALNFVVNETIPKVSYSTYLAQFFFAGYFATALSTMESFVAKALFNSYCPNEGDECGWIKSLDLTVLVVLALLEVVYLVVFMYLGLRKRAGEAPLPPLPVEKGPREIAVEAAAAALKKNE